MLKPDCIYYVIDVDYNECCYYADRIQIISSLLHREKSEYTYSK